MNRVEAISNRILKSDNFENVAYVCCDWQEFVFEVAELDTFIASFGCSPADPHPCSKYANPIFA